MPRYIVKLVDANANKDYYLEWSTVVDAPVTYGMGLTEFTSYYEREYGVEGQSGFSERMKRVHEKGTSARDYDNELQVVSHNRAGPGESPLTYAELVRFYCLREDSQDKHPVWELRRKANNWLCEGNFATRVNTQKLYDIFVPTTGQDTVLNEEAVQQILALEPLVGQGQESRQEVIKLLIKGNLATKANVLTVCELFRKIPKE